MAFQSSGKNRNYKEAYVEKLILETSKIDKLQKLEVLATIMYTLCFTILVCELFLSFSVYMALNHTLT